MQTATVGVKKGGILERADQFFKGGSEMTYLRPRLLGVRSRLRQKKWCCGVIFFQKYVIKKRKSEKFGCGTSA